MPRLQTIKTKIIMNNPVDLSNPKVKKPTTIDIYKDVLSSIASFPLKFIEQTKAELRGGAIRDIINRVTPVDWDFYFESEEDLYEAYKKLLQLTKELKETSTNHNINFEVNFLTDSNYFSSTPNFSFIGKHVADFKLMIYDKGVDTPKTVFDFDLVICPHNSYKKQLDFTANAGYLNATSFGTFVDTDLFYWSVVNKVVIPVNIPNKINKYDARVTKMYAKKYSHIYKTSVGSIAELLSYIEAI